MRIGRRVAHRTLQVRFDARAAEGTLAVLKTSAGDICK